jgi:hypothetical protein
MDGDGTTAIPRLDLPFAYTPDGDKPRRYGGQRFTSGRLPLVNSTPVACDYDPRSAGELDR